MSNIKQDYATRACDDYDMEKKIVMGPYYKYSEETEWYSHRVDPVGIVRVIENKLCHAVNDIEYFEQDQYDVCTQTERSSRKVTRWEPVTEEHID
jgi:hypothetical protein